MSETELNQLLNVETKVKLLDKEYNVQQLTLIEIAQIRKTIESKLYEQWKTDVLSVSKSMESKDRNKFIIEALKEKITEDKIQDEMMGEYGIKLILSKALKIDFIEVDKYIYSNDKSISISLQQVYKIALGITDEPEQSETK